MSNFPMDVAALVARGSNPAPVPNQALLYARLINTVAQLCIADSQGRNFLAALIQQTQLDLYVAASGSDDNDGLTPATPLLTLGGAYKRIPQMLMAPVIIHLADPLQWEACPAFVLLSPTAFVAIWGDGAGQVGNDGFNVVATGVADAGTNDINVALPAPVGVDTYQRFTIEMVDGAAAGQRRTIRNNTASSIVPVAAFTVAPAPGDTYRVLRPIVVADATVDRTLSYGAGSGSEQPLTLINLDFSGDFDWLRATGNNLLFYGCLTSSAYLYVQNSYVAAGVTNYAYGAQNQEALWAALGSDQSENWLGWGLGIDTDWTQGGAYNGEPESYEYNGFLVSLGGITNYGGRLTLAGGFVTNLYMDYMESHVTIQYSWNTRISFFIRPPASGFTGIYLDNGFLYDYDNLEIDATAAGVRGGIFLDANSVCELFDEGTFIQANATGYAIQGIGGTLNLWPSNNSNPMVLVGGALGLYLQGTQVTMHALTGATGGGVTVTSSDPNQPTVTMTTGATVRCYSGRHTFTNTGGGPALSVGTGSDFDISAQGPFTTLDVNSNGAQAACRIYTGGRVSTSGAGFTGLTFHCTGAGAGVELRSGGQLNTLFDINITGGLFGVDCRTGGKVTIGRQLNAAATQAGGVAVNCEAGEVAADIISAGASGIPATVNDIGIKCSLGGKVNSTLNAAVVGGVGIRAETGGEVTLRRPAPVQGTIDAAIVATSGGRVSIIPSGGGGAANILGATNGIDARGGGFVALANLTGLTVTASAGSEIIVGAGAGESGTVAALLTAANTSIQNTTSSKGGSTILRAA